MAINEKELKNKPNQLEVLKFSLKRQNEQGAALVEVIERVEQIENNVNEKYSQIEEIVNEVRNRVHIEHEDQQILRSIVHKNAHEVARGYYKSDNDYGAEIREMAGYAIRHQWSLLKKKFNVSRYTAIRHVDAEKAFEFARGIEFGSVFLHNYENWRRQRIKKKLRESGEVV